ncbi:MAG: phosphoribosylformylglycinamidine synthase subunit PurS [Spirochaetales bacterium]|nr:phosphoribosylformylglycinamidine synthase subunit PurS [Spirochaetales bacterium]
MQFQARILVALKASILDPAGQAVEKALHEQAFPEVQDVRIGRTITLKLSASNAAEAQARVEQYCKKLLVNPVIESSQVELEEIG